MKLAYYFLTLFCGIFCIVSTTSSQAEESRILASSGALHIDWSGDHGLLDQDAISGKTAEHYGLTYLRTDAGPKGHADYLIWLLARDNSSFKIIWGYMNAKGDSFWAWIYHYPENIVTLSEFKGSYSINPLHSPHSGINEAPIHLGTPPSYTGHVFKYLDWTSDHGTISRLTTTSPVNSKGKAAILTNLEISPLHEIVVPALNGWRDNAWLELHAVARDATGAPFYLILYSNSTKGFVISLEGGWVSPADFGSVVRFDQENLQPTPAAPEPQKPEVKEIEKYSTYEAEFETSTHYTNPFIDQQMEVDLQSPVGKEISVMGFWSSKSTWKFRFAPEAAGIWRWRTRSQDKQLDAREGSFECIPQGINSHGLLRINRINQGAERITWSDGTPFLPTTVDTNFCLLPNEIDVQSWLNNLRVKGADRITGGFLLDHTNQKLTIRAPSPLVKSDPKQLNPEYFDLLDKLVQQSTYNNLVLEIGLASSRSRITSEFKDDDLRRIWRYVIARYGCYNIMWKIFGDEDAAPTVQSEKRANGFEEMLRLYDLNKHPVGGLPTKLIRDDDQAAWNMIWETEMMLRTSCISVSNTLSSQNSAINKNISHLSNCTSFLKRTKFWRLSPHPELIENILQLQDISTKSEVHTANKLLADPGWEYILWLPEGGSVVLDLVEAVGHLKAVWYNPKTNQTLHPDKLQGAGHLSIAAPDNDPWALLLSRR